MIKRLELKGFQLVAMKFLETSEEIVRKHYGAAESREMSVGLFDYTDSGPIVVMAWEGEDIINLVQIMIGDTDPSDASPGTIRGDFGIESGRNLIHSSDSVRYAKFEIASWFSEDELVKWIPSSDNWVYEKAMPKAEEN